MLGFRTGYFTSYFLLSASLPVFALTAYLTYAGIRECCRSSEKMANIPYVPPVARQLSALSDEDILLRGADHPADSEHGLLRAAHAGPDQAEKELLRAGTKRQP